MTSLFQTADIDTVSKTSVFDTVQVVKTGLFYEASKDLYDSFPRQRTVLSSPLQFLNDL